MPPSKELCDLLFDFAAYSNIIGLVDVLEHTVAASQSCLAGGPWRVLNGLNCLSYTDSPLKRRERQTIQLISQL